MPKTAFILYEKKLNHGRFSQHFFVDTTPAQIGKNIHWDR